MLIPCVCNKNAIKKYGGACEAVVEVGGSWWVSFSSGRGGGVRDGGRVESE